MVKIVVKLWYKIVNPHGNVGIIVPLYDVLTITYTTVAVVTAMN